jgi:D-3-phosphoglycerate dehydrogenase / 2-oxoglutarate reductase
MVIKFVISSTMWSPPACTVSRVLPAVSPGPHRLQLQNVVAMTVSRRSMLDRHHQQHRHSQQPIRTFADVEVEHVRAEWRTYGNLENYKPGKHQIKTFNKISPFGLSRFPSDSYDIIADDGTSQTSAKNVNAHAILLRSHKLQEDQVAHTVRAIARCGAGTNNIPVARMTELGIPVFNTPGANANAVKELIICGLFLGSRKLIDGINHMKELGRQGLAAQRVEKDKAQFGGKEITGKTLAVIGLGHIGAATARDAQLLGST